MERASRAVWAKRVRRWVESGLTASEFAARTGINARTLSYWKWRLGSEREQGATSAARPAGNGFVEVVAPVVVGAAREHDTAGRPDPLVLRLGGGRRLQIPSNFDSAALRRVLDVLEGR